MGSVPQSGDEAAYMYGNKPDESVVRGHAARTVERCCQYMIPTLQQKYAAEPRLRVLDAGCGPGSITLGIARMIPDGHVTGVDFSESVLETAKAQATAQGVENVDFALEDVYRLPFEDDTFDIVHTHQGMAHFHRHVEAMRELVRVAKPGGVVCMREGILPSAQFHPPNPLLQDFWDRVLIKGIADNNAVADAGMRLKEWALAAGIPVGNVSLTMDGDCYSTPAERDMWGGVWVDRCLKSAIADSAVKLGNATWERMKEYSDEWRRWNESEQSVFSMLEGQVIITKP